MRGLQKIRPRRAGAVFGAARAAESPFTENRSRRQKGPPLSRTETGNPIMTIERYETGPRMSQAVAHGDLVYLAGQVAADVVGTGVTAQTQQILEQIDRLLMAAGSDKSRILSATIYLADIAGFAEMNAAWDAWVDRENPPARATVEARLVAPEYRVEIAVTAARGKS
jgi:enamine deaminase RidA (YjgF/YER057c/UK114 family)